MAKSHAHGVAVVKWLVSVLVIMAGLAAMKQKELVSAIRGLRNNNPGNIRWNGFDQWEGMTGTDGQNFIIFESVEYGIRAMYRILSNYAGRGVETLSDIISTWAPAEDSNDVDAYVASVASRTGLQPGATVRPEQYPALIKAIIHHENGINPYSDALIERGVAMA